MGVSRVLMLAGCVVAAVLAVLLLLTGTTVSVLTAIGWLAVAVALGLASRLTP